MFFLWLCRKLKSHWYCRIYRTVFTIQNNFLLCAHPFSPLNHSHPPPLPPKFSCHQAGSAVHWQQWTQGRKTTSLTSWSQWTSGWGLWLWSPGMTWWMLQHTHTHTQINTYAHTHTLSLFPSHTHTLSYLHTHTHSLSLFFTNTHTHSLSLSQTHFFSLLFTHAHTPWHIHALSLSLIHTHTQIHTH